MDVPGVSTVTYSDQLALLQILVRIAEHFTAASFSYEATRDYHGSCITIAAALAMFADAIIRKIPTDRTSLLTRHLLGRGFARAIYAQHYGRAVAAAATARAAGDEATANEHERAARWWLHASETNAKGKNTTHAYKDKTDAHGAAAEKQQGKMLPPFQGECSVTDSEYAHAPYGLDLSAYVRQSQVCESAFPAAMVGRNAIVNYFRSIAVPVENRIFCWEVLSDGVPEESTTELLRHICSATHFPLTALTQYAASDGVPTHAHARQWHHLVVRQFPEFALYRDISVHFKLSLLADRGQIPVRPDYDHRDARIEFVLDGGGLYFDMYAFGRRLDLSSAAGVSFTSAATAATLGHSVQGSKSLLGLSSLSSSGVSGPLRLIIAPDTVCIGVVSTAAAEAATWAAVINAQKASTDTIKHAMTGSPKVTAENAFDSVDITTSGDVNFPSVSATAVGANPTREAAIAAAAVASAIAAATATTAGAGPTDARVSNLATDANSVNPVDAAASAGVASTGQLASHGGIGASDREHNGNGSTSNLCALNSAGDTYVGSDTPSPGISSSDSGAGNGGDHENDAGSGLPLARLASAGGDSPRLSPEPGPVIDNSFTTPPPPLPIMLLDTEVSSVPYYEQGDKDASTVPLFGSMAFAHGGVFSLPGTDMVTETAAHFQTWGNDNAGNNASHNGGPSLSGSKLSRKLFTNRGDNLGSAQMPSLRAMTASTSAAADVAATSVAVAAAAASREGGGALYLPVADSEILLSYLNVPYLRLPLLLQFFAREDRVQYLQSIAAQTLLDAATFEPGGVQVRPQSALAHPHSHDYYSGAAVKSVQPPANASKTTAAQFTVGADAHAVLSQSDILPTEEWLVPTYNRALLTTPFGLLMNELVTSPSGVLRPIRRILTTALDLQAADAVVDAPTIALVLYAIRLAGKVNNYVVYLTTELARDPCAQRVLALSNIAVTPAALVMLRREGAALMKLLTTRAFDTLGDWTKRVESAFGRDSNVTRLNELTVLLCRLQAHRIVIGRNVARFLYTPSFAVDVISSVTTMCLRSSSISGVAAGTWRDRAASALAAAMATAAADTVAYRKDDITVASMNANGNATTHTNPLSTTVNTNHANLDDLSSSGVPSVFSAAGAYGSPDGGGLTFTQIVNSTGLCMHELVLAEVVQSKRRVVCRYIASLPHDVACAILDACVRITTGTGTKEHARMPDGSLVPPLENNWGFIPGPHNRGRFKIIDTTDNPEVQGLAPAPAETDAQAAEQGQQRLVSKESASLVLDRQRWQRQWRVPEGATPRAKPGQTESTATRFFVSQSGSSGSSVESAVAPVVAIAGPTAPKVNIAGAVAAAALHQPLLTVRPSRVEDAATQYGIATPCYHAPMQIKAGDHKIKGKRKSKRKDKSKDKGKDLTETATDSKRGSAGAEARPSMPAPDLAAARSQSLHQQLSPAFLSSMFEVKPLLSCRQPSFETPHWRFSRDGKTMQSSSSLQPPSLMAHGTASAATATGVIALSSRGSLTGSTRRFFADDLNTPRMGAAAATTKSAFKLVSKHAASAVPPDQQPRSDQILMDASSNGRSIAKAGANAPADDSGIVMLSPSAIDNESRTPSPLDLAHSHAQ